MSTSREGDVCLITREEYDRLERTNWSKLKHLGRSPAHFRQILLEPPSDTPSKRLGRAVHMAALEPERFAGEFVVWRDGRRAGKAWDAFQKKHADREILTESEHGQCMDIQRAVRGDATAARYVSGGAGEVSVLWTHIIPAIGGLPERAIDCKGRVDFITRDALVDLKTTRDGSPDGFARECWRYRYHVQAAFYADGHEAAAGQRLPYVIVAVETELPHVVQVYRVPDEVLDVGRQEYRQLLEQLAFCRAESRWPGYFEGEGVLTLPRWAVDFPGDEDVAGLGLVIGGEAVAT